MKLPSDIENQVNSFLKPSIKFNSLYKQYTYNKKWLNEITEEYLKRESLNILKDINSNLKSGNNTKDFLKYLIQLIEKRLDFYVAKKSYTEFGFIEFNIENISSTDYWDGVAPEPEKFSIKDIVEENETVIDLIYLEESYYYDIYRFRREFNNYINPMDIELVKLYYVVNLHNEVILTLYQYINDILEDFDNINFNKFHFEDLLIKYGLLETTEAIATIQKCHINLNKVDVANLFHLLLDEQIFSFNQNTRENKVLLKKFIEQNFTYKDDDKNQKNIVKINKEYSKVEYSNPESHLAFLESFISILKNRITKLSKDSL